MYVKDCDKLFVDYLSEVSIEVTSESWTIVPNNNVYLKKLSSQ